MARKLASDREELLERARPDMVHPARTVQQENRYIFSGDKPKTDPQARTPGYARPRHNKGGPARKRWPMSSVVLVMFAAAIAMILYVSNILAVNRLARDVHEKQLQLDRLVNSNGLLQAEINRKSAWDRIGNVATQELGLKYSKATPETFEVDNHLLEKYSRK